MAKVKAVIKPVDYLLSVADALDGLKRFGQPVDSPEGARFIILSDTLAAQLAKDLREVHAGLTTRIQVAGR